MDQRRTGSELRRASTPGNRPRLAAAAILAGMGLPGGLAGVGQDTFITPQSELFTNVTVIDGRGGPPRPSSAVLVWGGRIRDIGAQGSVAAPEGTVVVDLSGSYLVPGFIDAHASPRATEELRALLAAGITGVRDGATSLAAFEERGRGGFGDDPVPSVYVGGPVLDAGSATRGVALESEAAAVAEVERQAADGAGFVSVASGVPPSWLVGIARAARRAEVPLWADRRDGGWLLALRAGSTVAGPLVSGDAELLPEGERGPFEALAEAGQVPVQVAWLERLGAARARGRPRRHRAPLERFGPPANARQRVRLPRLSGRRRHLHAAVQRQPNGARGGVAQGRGAGPNLPRPRRPPARGIRRSALDAVG